MVTARVHRRRRARDAGLSARRPAPGRPRSTGPAIIAEANATTVVEPGWRAERHARAIISCSSASHRAPARAAVGTARRPGAAGGLQQPVHVDRRADGRRAAEHRLLGEHQGAARLLLRAVRRRGRPDRQRAAHAGAPRLDGRLRAHDRCAPAPRTHAPGRRVRAQRPLQRRHPPARRHRGHAGVRCDGGELLFFVAVARPPRRHRRHHARLDAARQRARSTRRAC